MNIVASPGHTPVRDQDSVYHYAPFKTEHILLDILPMLLISKSIKIQRKVSSPLLWICHWKRVAK